MSARSTSILPLGRVVISDRDMWMDASNGEQREGNNVCIWSKECGASREPSERSTAITSACARNPKEEASTHLSASNTNVERQGSRRGLVEVSGAPLRYHASWSNISSSFCDLIDVSFSWTGSSCENSAFGRQQATVGQPRSTRY